MVRFRKRQRQRGEAIRAVARQETIPSAFIQIAFEMMLKGNISTRKGERIRQFCVIVDGSPRIVTSGDVVDRKTYEALVAAGAVGPGPQNAPPNVETETRA